MKLNINKEQLIKHRFWIMLGVSIFLETVTLVLLVTSVKAIYDENYDTLDKANKKGNTEAGNANVKTPSQIKGVSDKEKELGDKRGGIHAEGYQAQKHIHTFPQKLEGDFEFTNGLFAEMIRINKEKEVFAKNDLDKNIVHGVITETATSFILVKDCEKEGRIWKFYDSPSLNDKWIFHTGKIKSPLSAFEKLEVGWSVSVFFQRGKFFGDLLTSEERIAFSKVYKEQIDPILALVDPIDENGKGRVRLNRALAFLEMPTSDDNPWPYESFSEDFWIFQENLWVYKEIFGLIKDANDSVAKFKVDKIYAKGKKKDALPIAYVCTNPYWKVKLTVTGEDTAEATFENLLSRGQKLDFELKLIVAGAAEPVMLKSPKIPPVFNPNGFSASRETGVEEGEDIQTVTLKVVSVDGKNSVDLQQVEIKEVWQELNWETAAIRRIDGIYVSAMNPDVVSESHRSFPKALKAYVPQTSGAGVTDPKAPATGKSPPATGKGKEKEKEKDKSKDNKSIYGSEETRTKLGQIRERYSELSSQLRRLPVAVCLTIEQTQVNRVQSAFSNSKLRFNAEQVVLTHSAGSLNPGAAKRDSGQKERPKEKTDTGVKKGKNTGKDSSKDTRPNPTEGGGSAGDELEANLEIVIYGVITFYERFPYRAVRPNWN